MQTYILHRNPAFNYEDCFHKNCFSDVQLPVLVCKKNDREKGKNRGG